MPVKTTGVVEEKKGEFVSRKVFYRKYNQIKHYSLCKLILFIIGLSSDKKTKVGRWVVLDTDIPMSARYHSQNKVPVLYA